MLKGANFVLVPGLLPEVAQACSFNTTHAQNNTATLLELNIYKQITSGSFLYFIREPRIYMLLLIRYSNVYIIFNYITFILPP
jgi:hypothetical protein